MQKYGTLCLLAASLTLPALSGQTTVTLSTTPNPSIFGAPVSLVAAITPANATGRVTFYDGVEVLGSQAITAGSASLLRVLLPAGTRRLKAYYSGDSSNSAVTSSIFTQAVTARPSSGGFSQGNPYSALNVWVADFNNDGLADVATYFPGNLVRFTLSNGQGSFASGNATIPTGYMPIAIADFDRDGAVDILAADTSSNKVTIYPGKGDGSFLSALALSLPDARSAVAADFNGDGKLDLALPALTTSVAIVLGNGDGSFQSPISYPASVPPGAWSSGIWLGDFNGDGKADLATMQPADSTLSILLGNGDGSLQPPLTLSTSNPCTGLSLGDWNQDGKLDLAYTTLQGLYILAGNGNGSFSAAVGHSLPGAVSPLAADFDGDGKTDLMVVKSNTPSTGSPSLFLGNGAGAFSFSRSLPLLSDRLVGAADFNSDGRTDLVTDRAVSLASTVALIATGGTPQSTAAGTPFPKTLEVTVRDSGMPVAGASVTFLVVNNNSAWATLSPQLALTDLAGVARVTATANASPGTYNVLATYSGMSAVFTLTNTVGPPALLNVTSGTPQIVGLGAPFAAPLQIKLTDAAGNPASGVVVNFAAPASGATAVLSSTSTTTDSSGFASVSATAGMTNGSYVVTASVGALTARFSLANALVSTVTVTTSPNPSALSGPVTLTATVSPSTVAGRLAFYDGSALLGTRAVVGGAASFSTSLLSAGKHRLSARYVGGAGFAPSVAVVTHTVRGSTAVGFRAGPLQPFPPALRLAAAADLNGDGRPDLVMFEGYYGNVDVLLNKGDGTFHKPVGYRVADAPSSVAVADFNGDRKADIAVSTSDNQGQGLLALLIGNGDGTFQRSVFSSIPSGSLIAADFNLDGMMDLALSSSAAVLLSNGDGTFQAPIAQANLLYSNPLETSDFDNDGIPDLFSSNGTVRVALGNGDGTFRSPHDSSIYGYGGDALADFNGDGLTDLAVTTSNNLSVSLSNGDGTFRSLSTYVLNGKVAAADFDGDGLIDLASTAENKVTLLRGRGDGTFEIVLSYTVSDSISTLIPADFDGDGRTDLAAIGNGVTILSGVPAGVTLNALGGGGQYTLTGLPFVNPLQVIVVQNGSPVNGAIVNFAVPSGGASATLLTATAVTNPAGIASLPVGANSIPGNYVVTASYQGMVATFNLTNSAIASIEMTGGAPQSVVRGSTFPVPLRFVVKDTAGNPAVGARIEFSAPATGASAYLQSYVTTDATGMAAFSAIANYVAGTYTIVASSGGRSVSFQLTNTELGSISVQGSQQSTWIGTAFSKPLQVKVIDSIGKPVSGIQVLFRSPETGASTSNTSSYTTTDSTGTAVFGATANRTPGTYKVTAQVSVNESTQTGTFTLTNLPLENLANVALGRLATQSSTLAGYATSGAGGAVDGNTDGNFFRGSVTHTNAEPYAWWQVDLGSPSVIQSVSVWTRTDCCADRLANYWVFIGRYPFSATDTPSSLQYRSDVLAIHQTVAPNGVAVLPANAYSGRFVRVQIDGQNALSLAEVQVMGTPTNPDTNLAMGRPATQSSTLAAYPSAAASAAVDGNTDGNFFHGSVTHTNQESNTWWQVDLGNAAKINSIVIWNRTDCCGDRLKNYIVAVSRFPFGATDGASSLAGRANTYTSFQYAAPGPMTTIALDNYVGQYVRVQALESGGPLSLAEVQVFGTPGLTSAANIALAKPATQSSTLAGYPSAVAASAVDGNTNGAFFAGSVTHTNLETNAWWQVDLGASANVDTVVIWNRTDPCCGGRFSNAFVFVSDTPFGPDDTPAILQNRSDVAYRNVSQGLSTLADFTGTRGRYVRVQLNGTNSLNLAEVQVFGTLPGPTNLAAGKAATQSSTLVGYSMGSAAAAVDGNTNGNFFLGSVTHTNSEANAWWQVDLETPASMSSIVLWNRTDCCGDRLGDYWVFVSNTPFSASDTPATLQARTGTTAIHQVGPPNPSTTIALTAQGRYVRVQSAGTNALSLAEVQVIGQ